MVTKVWDDLGGGSPDQIHGATFQVDNANAVFHRVRTLQSTRQSDVLLSHESDRNPITDCPVKELGGLFRSQVPRTLL